MAFEFSDNDWAAGKGRVLMFVCGNDPFVWLEGHYAGPEGMVQICGEKPTGLSGRYNERGYTLLEAVADGRVHRRTYRAWISHRGLAKKCRQFLADVGGTEQ